MNEKIELDKSNKTVPTADALEAYSILELPASGNACELNLQQELNLLRRWYNGTKQFAINADLIK